MQRIMSFAFLIAIGWSAAGCGRGEILLRTEGRLLKGGEPFIPEEGQNIQITFVPIRKDGKPPKNHYYADVDQETGTFVPDGAQKKGMPPGKYRVAVELMKKKVDLFDGKFDELRSPFEIEVDQETDEIVIDLDDAPAVASS